ncbi:hypothetical protein B2A_11520, partial [mine drainage metagenome]
MDTPDGERSTLLEMNGLRPVAELAERRPHGDRLRYMAGCRCLPCRCANARYEQQRLAARRRGEWNGLVPAGPVRAHLRKLSAAGVGYKTAADAASVARSGVEKIVLGQRRKIRAQTAKRLLAVTPAARADHSTVPAGRTWRLINQLLEEGFSKARLARELGMRTP